MKVHCSVPSQSSFAPIIKEINSEIEIEIDSNSRPKKEVKNNCLRMVCNSQKSVLLTESFVFQSILDFPSVLASVWCSSSGLVRNENLDPRNPEPYGLHGNSLHSIFNDAGTLCHSPILNEQGTGITVKELTLDESSTCIIANEDDEIRCFGNNNYGELGLGHMNSIGGIQHYPETKCTFSVSYQIECCSQFY